MQDGREACVCANHTLIDPPGCGGNALIHGYSEFFEALQGWCDASMQAIRPISGDSDEQYDGKET